MALDTLLYDILPYSREFDELGNLYYFERIVVEANTSGVSVTPTVTFNDTTTTFTPFSSTTRGFSEIPINRLGPVTSVSLMPINYIEWYGVETFIRPLELGVQLVHAGGGPERKSIVMFPGRTSDAATSISFDINPFSFPEDARHVNPVLRFLWLDIVTGAESVTPVLVNDAGVETTLAAITNATRDISEYSILATNRIKTVRLDGDFTNPAIILFDLECDLYVPNKRRMAVA